MRILVLGGTGAMGEPIVKLLGNNGHEVYVTSRKERESRENIHYLQGDAHDLPFVREVLGKGYDAIVDFMIYSTEDFKERSRLYLDATQQYMFLSSARVYAESKEPITEESPRLLDACRDMDYLKTDEYALAKARSENVLFNSDRNNWTIIRPYITYNTHRLQLGGLELDTWLTATLSGRPLVLPKDVGICKTTLTHGEDVARAMVALIGNQRALGEAFHITGSDNMTWNEVANIYCDVLESCRGKRPEIYAPETSRDFVALIGNWGQINYDRKYNRVFDNTKLINACGEELTFIPMKDGLTTCLKEYLSLAKVAKPMFHNAKYEAWIDRATGRGSSLEATYNTKERLKYLGYYYMPKAMGLVKVIKGYRNNKH